MTTEDFKPIVVQVYNKLDQNYVCPHKKTEDSQMTTDSIHSFENKL